MLIFYLLLNLPNLHFYSGQADMFYQIYIARLQYQHKKTKCFIYFLTVSLKKTVSVNETKRFLFVHCYLHWEMSLLFLYKAFLMSFGWEKIIFVFDNEINWKNEINLREFSLNFWTKLGRKLEQVILSSLSFDGFSFYWNCFHVFVYCWLIYHT